MKDTFSSQFVVRPSLLLAWWVFITTMIVMVIFSATQIALYQGYNQQLIKVAVSSARSEMIAEYIEKHNQVVIEADATIRTCLEQKDRAIEERDTLAILCQWRRDPR